MVDTDEREALEAFLEGLESSVTVASEDVEELLSELEPRDLRRWLVSDDQQPRSVAELRAQGVAEARVQRVLHLLDVTPRRVPRAARRALVLRSFEYVEEFRLAVRGRVPYGVKGRCLCGLAWLGSRLESVAVRIRGWLKAWGR